LVGDSGDVPGQLPRQRQVARRGPPLVTILITSCQVGEQLLVGLEAPGSDLLVGVSGDDSFVDEGRNLVVGQAQPQGADDAASLMT
jgi:hypothetical protein